MIASAATHTILILVYTRKISRSSKPTNLPQFNVEQECNVFLKKKVLPRTSIHWRRAIPIPVYPPLERDTSNFMGRLCNALLRITDYKRTVYACECLGWYLADGTETAGIKLFTFLNSSVGVAGLGGVDRLLSFRIVHNLKAFLQQFYNSAITPLVDRLQKIEDSLDPHFSVPTSNPPNFYKKCLSGFTKVFAPMTGYVLGIGQSQLLRKQISHELQFSCHLDSNLLSHAMKNLNKALLLDLRAHYQDPEKPAPSKDNPLLVEMSRLSEATGNHNPLRQIYVVCDSRENLATLLFLFVVSCLPKLAYDTSLVALVRRKANDGIDGAPLVAGVATILKQFHPGLTLKFFGYLGQFARATLEYVLSDVKIQKSGAGMPYEVINALIFMDHFARCAGIPKTVLDSFVPRAVYDSIGIQ